MPGTAEHPFALEPLSTIPLDPPPLARVLAQVRFVPIFDADSQGQVGRLQRTLATRYPLANEELELAIVLSSDPSSPPSPTPKRLWRFSDLERTWRITLTADFVTLETDLYAGHADFFSRFSEVLNAVAEAMAPPLATRVGVRYVQRIEDADTLEQLPSLIRPEVLGVVGLPQAAPKLRLGLTTAQFALEEGQVLLGKWGLVPEAFLLDLGLTPAQGPSWILDLDIFNERQEPFAPDVILERALGFSRRQYRFFRWAVEPAFLRRFGAQEELIAQAVDVMEGS